MSLSESLNNISPSFPGLPCGIKKIMENLKNKEDKKALEDIMNRSTYPRGVSNRQIHEVLLSEGYDIAFASIRLHRSKQCRCYIGKNSEKRRNLGVVVEQPVFIKKAEKTSSRKVASKKKSLKSKSGK